MAKQRVYRLDRRGTRRLMRSPEMQALLRAVVEERAKPFAEAISPQDTGEYATSFEVSAGATDERAEVVLTNTSPHAPFVELNHRVLSRTVDHLEGGGG